MGFKNKYFGAKRNLGSMYFFFIICIVHELYAESLYYFTKSSCEPLKQGNSAYFIHQIMKFIFFSMLRHDLYFLPFFFDQIEVHIQITTELVFPVLLFKDFKLFYHTYTPSSSPTGCSSPIPSSLCSLVIVSFCIQFDSISKA